MADTPEVTTGNSGSGINLLILAQLAAIGIIVYVYIKYMRQSDERLNAMQRDYEDYLRSSNSSQQAADKLAEEAANN